MQLGGMCFAGMVLAGFSSMDGALYYNGVNGYEGRTMIHYHGGPITPITAALRCWSGRHAFISFAYPEQVDAGADVCQSFALDNGAFSSWRGGHELDCEGFYSWVDKWKKHPGCDFAIIPDVIDGDEDANDLLISEWPHGSFGVPVWHMHESIDRLVNLCSSWPRVALGSSGKWSVVGSVDWWDRMCEAMNAICDKNGMPQSKLHGLRMLNPEVFKHLPLSSADSTNVAANIGKDSRWTGTYVPASKDTKAQVIAERIELHNSKPWAWSNRPRQVRMFA